MDTILVVHAGPSCVKFQIYSVEREGRLRQQLKGRVDGLYAGVIAAALQGLDAFVFTAGIGENSASIRARVAEQLAWLGVKLDAAENVRHSQLISSSASLIPVYVVSSDEGLMIARHTLALLMDGNSKNPRHESAS